METQPVALPAADLGALVTSRVVTSYTHFVKQKPQKDNAGISGRRMLHVHRHQH